MEDGGQPLRLPPITDPANYDIQVEWDRRGPGERDAYLTELGNQGFRVPSRVDLDSAYSPLIGAPLLPAHLAGLPTGDGRSLTGVRTGDPTGSGRPLFLPDIPDGPNTATGPSYLPSIAPGPGSGIAAGLGGLLPGLGLGPNLSLGLGGLWNVLWWGALGYAVYTGIRRVPRKSELSTALLNGGLAGAVMGFASDRARQS